MLSLFALQLSFEVAVFGVVFTRYLIEPGAILSWYGKLLYKAERSAPWLVKPLGMCERCVTGQVAFWLYLAIYWPLDWIGGCHMVFFISLSIFWASLLVAILDLFRRWS